MDFTKLALVLGNCLFPSHHKLSPDTQTLFFMAEDEGLCTHFQYHKHKLILFLSAMRSHAEDIEKQHRLVYHQLSNNNRKVSYTDKLKSTLADYPRIKEITTYDVEDHFFERTLREFCEQEGLKLTQVDSPAFMTTKKQFKRYKQKAKKPFMQVFYKQQRKNLGILVNSNGEPLNGQWSFDEANRKKYPKDIQFPDYPESEETTHTAAVKALVDELFPDHPGETRNFFWATSRRQVLHRLDVFLKERFENFGPYEDAIHSRQTFGFHSLLSPYLNMGLITPEEVIEKALEYYEEHQTHFPSVEGFVRQIIGWREFMRGIYHEYDDKLNVNYFNHHRKMKNCWYEGNTGVPPLDDSIKKAKKYAYTHHIERLMVLGNLMLLSELDPKEVYKWFMEMYIDSADWVMAPNVYGMSQYADGGIFATKPYIGGANYIKKMSDYGSGDWEEVVNGLYWRFINVNTETFAKNRRMSMMVATLNRMNADKKERIFKAADDFIEKTTKT
jgi:deoxyribodipyrimidine photolyase-related protein